MSSVALLGGTSFSRRSRARRRSAAITGAQGIQNLACAGLSVELSSVTFASDVVRPAALGSPAPRSGPLGQPSHSPLVTRLYKPMAVSRRGASNRRADSPGVKPGLAPGLPVRQDTDVDTPEVIRTQRLRLGMTQGELARAIGVDERTLRRYELGEQPPSLAHAKLLAHVLEVTLDELAGDS